MRNTESHNKHRHPYQKIDYKKIEQIIYPNSYDLLLLDSIIDLAKEERANFSKEQLKFLIDATKLATGKLVENKPILVGVKCGFGKSTFINLFIKANIIRQIEHIHNSKKFSMILVSERLNDLKKLQTELQNEFGYYYQSYPWLYVLESWNESIKCINKVSSYAESLEVCPNCKAKCKLKNQNKIQRYSPILGITTSRFNKYADKSKLHECREWESNKNTEFRDLIFIDEKPQLVKSINISTKEIDLLNNMIERIESYLDPQTNLNKTKMRLDLNKLRDEIMFFAPEFSLERNAYKKYNKDVFSKDFISLWNLYYPNRTNSIIPAITDIFKNGTVICNTKNYQVLKSLEMSKFDVSDFKTIIFDGTAELSLEYNVNNFISLDVYDYRDYHNVNFHVIDENYSKTRVSNKKLVVLPIVNWISKNIEEPTYLVSYKDISQFLFDHLKDNVHIIKDKNPSQKECIAYFGNTKGKNDFRNCRKMIHLGWHRWDSDTYIAYRIATDPDLKNRLEAMDKDEMLNTLEIDSKGIFKNEEFEFYKNMQMINEFEQEVFRTKEREFNCDERVDIYIFNCSNVMREMIKQRFVNCNFIKDEWSEIVEFKMRSRKNSEDNKELKLLTFLDNWDKTPIEIKDIRNKLDIDVRYWRKLKAKPLVIKKFSELQIHQEREGNKYYLKVYKK